MPPDRPAFETFPHTARITAEITYPIRRRVMPCTAIDVHTIAEPNPKSNADDAKPETTPPPRATGDRPGRATARRRSKSR